MKFPFVLNFPMIFIQIDKRISFSCQNVVFSDRWDNKEQIVRISNGPERAKFDKIIKYNLKLKKFCRII